MATGLLAASPPQAAPPPPWASGQGRRGEKLSSSAPRLLLRSPLSADSLCPHCSLTGPAVPPLAATLGHSLPFGTCSEPPSGHSLQPPPSFPVLLFALSVPCLERPSSLSCPRKPWLGRRPRSSVPLSMGPMVLPWTRPLTGTGKWLEHRVVVRPSASVGQTGAPGPHVRGWHADARRAGGGLRVATFLQTSQKFLFIF